MPKRNHPFPSLIYRASQVANFFIEQSFREGDVYLSPLKLLKLVYFSYGWWLGVTEQRLFDEPFEAWRYGPVIPSLYHEFKRYGRGRILRISKEIELSDEVEEGADVIDQLGGRCIDLQLEPLDEDVALALGWTWARYQPYSAVDLSQITHQPDSPWARAKKRSGGLGGLLSDDDLHEHFCLLMKQAQ